MCLAMLLVGGGMLCAQPSLQSSERLNLTGGFFVEANSLGFFCSNMGDAVNSMRTGIGAGGYLNIEINSWFSIQGELDYQFKRTVFCISGTDGQFRYWGVGVPVYAMFKFGLGGGKMLAAIGPYTDFGFGASYKSDGSTIDVYAKDASTDLPVMNASDTGFGARLGYEMRSGIAIYATYKVGVSNVLDANSYVAEMRPHTLAFGVSYKLFR